MDSRDIEKWRVKLDSYANVEDGVEYWLARDLMEPMGYTRWENFAEVVKRAKVSCETNKTPVDSHFRDTTKMVTAGVAARAVKDYKLTRYACYLIAQNGDSNKPEIALAQAYFAVQTRRQELIEQRFAEIQRLQARHSLSDSEKHLSGIAFKRGVDSKGFAIIKSKGDEALFGGRSTAEMKQQLGVPKRAGSTCKASVPFRVRPHARSTKKRPAEASRFNMLWWAVRGQPAAQAAAAALRALRAALVNAYAFPQLCALSGSTPCKVNKKDGQLSLTVLTCFGGPSGGRTLDLGIKSPLLYQLS